LIGRCLASSTARCLEDNIEYGKRAAAAPIGKLGLGRRPFVFANNESKDVRK
jgi:hypothetical protein